MFFALDRKTLKFFGMFDDVDAMYRQIENKGLKVEDFYCSEEINMKYISSVVYFNGECVYNNKEFWTKTAWDDSLILDFENQDVKDICGRPVEKERFLRERYSNAKRLNHIDGRPGQIDYNMAIGKEFISLFREECILTKFDNSNTSPMIIFEKLAAVISMLDAGAFREAKQYLIGYRTKLIDDFLTNERIDKYISMLDAADVIEYATKEDYFYHIPE